MKKKKKASPHRPINTERDKKIRFMYDNGNSSETLQSIADIYGLTRARIQQIVKGKK